MGLLTVEDLQVVMGRTSRPFNDDEIGVASYIIDEVTEYIKSRIPGIAFEVTNVVDEKVQADFKGIIDLSDYPINDITSVKNARSGLNTTWEWDDYGTIFGLAPYETVLVSYSYGFDTVPNDLVTLAKGLALRGFSNPTGIRQQTVGAISETYASQSLTDTQEAIIAKYIPIGYSLRLGPSMDRIYQGRTLPTL